MTAEPLRLMIPGPVGVEDDVLAALAQPVLPHYGYEWLDIYNETIERLQQIFGTQGDIFLMPGPGSAGLDAAIGSLARTGDKVLVAINGFFGERWATIGRSYGLNVRTVAAPMGQPIDPEAVRQRLRSEPGIQAVALVHLETSTAVLNPLREVASIAREFEVPVMVDAVSTLGGIPLPVDEWGLDICVTVGNKCLGCPPGIAPLSVSQRAWDQMDRTSGRAHGWYQNLRTWKDYALNWANWHPYPVTLPTNLIVGLLTSLRRIQDGEGGLQAHYERHVRAAGMVRSGLERLGFELWTPEAHTSPLISAVRVLPGMDVTDFRQYLEDEWRIMISGGLQELRDKIFRLGHIGRAASTEYSEYFLQAVEAYLRLKGLGS